MLYLYAQSLTLEHILGYFDSTTVLTEYGTLSKFNDKELDHEQKYFFTTVGEDVSGFLIWNKYISIRCNILNIFKCISGHQQ